MPHVSVVEYVFITKRGDSDAPIKIVRCFVRRFERKREFDANFKNTGVHNGIGW